MWIEFTADAEGNLTAEVNGHTVQIVDVRRNGQRRRVFELCRQWFTEPTYTERSDSILYNKIMRAMAEIEPLPDDLPHEHRRCRK